MSFVWHFERLGFNLDIVKSYSLWIMMNSYILTFYRNLERMIPDCYHLDIVTGSANNWLYKMEWYKYSAQIKWSQNPCVMFSEAICWFQECEGNVLKYELRDQKFKIYGGCSWIIRNVPAWSDRINSMSSNVFWTYPQAETRLSFQVIHVHRLRCNFSTSVLDLRACLETVDSLWYQIRCATLTVSAVMLAFYSEIEIVLWLRFPEDTWIFQAWEGSFVQK